MPQMNPRGKFVFGKSRIRDHGEIHIPPQAAEYSICCKGRIYLFTGAKASGGFCVTRKGLLLPSKIGNILRDTPDLCEYRLLEGSWIDYKGRKYGWLPISADGVIQLSNPMLTTLALSAGMELLSIRSSNIAFTMAAKGPLLEKAGQYPGTIPLF